MDGLFDYTAFREALGAGADLLEFFAVLIGAGTTMFVWLRRRTNAKLQEANRVQQQIYEANRRNGRLRATLGETVAEATRTNRQRKAQAHAVPSEVWNMAGGERPDTGLLQQWLDDTRDGMAQACGQLGEWYAMHARAPAEEALPEAEARAAQAVALRNLWLAVNLDPGQAAWRDMAEQLGIDMAWSEIRAGALPSRSFMLPVTPHADEAYQLARQLNEISSENWHGGFRWDALLVAKQAEYICSRHPKYCFFQNSTSQRRIANALFWLGHKEKSMIVICKQIALINSVKHYQNDNPDYGIELLRLQWQLYSFLSHKGPFQLAEFLLEGLVQRFVNHSYFGLNHRETLNAEQSHIWALYKLKRYDEALLKSKNLLVKQSKNESIGYKHYDYLVSEHNLACILLELQRYDEALQAIEANIGRKMTCLGLRHRETLISQLIKSRILAKLGRVDAALSLASELLETQENDPEIGINHPDTFLTRQLIEDLKKSSERFEAGLDTYNQGTNTFNINAPRNVSVKFNTDENVADE